MKNISVILATSFVGLFCICHPAYSWSDNTTHPTVTEKAIQLSTMDKYLKNQLGVQQGLAAEFQIVLYPALQVRMAALWTGNISKSITFVSEDSAEVYSQILEAIETHMQDFAGGMGPMTLISSKPGKAKYEMQHEYGGNTYIFPVIFIKDEDGNWKIHDF
jgi:hypothetical protein